MRNIYEQSYGDYTDVDEDNVIFYTGPVDPPRPDTRSARRGLHRKTDFEYNERIRVCLRVGSTHQAAAACRERIAHELAQTRSRAPYTWINTRVSMDRLREEIAAGLYDEYTKEESKNMDTLSQQVKDDVAQIQRVMDYMNTQVLEREELIEGLWVGAVAGHHVVAVGDPGAAKTMLADLFAECIRQESGEPLRLFSKQFSSDMTRTELLGPIHPTPLIERGEYVYNLDNGAANAHIVLADEFDKASKGTRDSWLGLLNERRVNQGSGWHYAPLIIAMLTANQFPEGDMASAYMNRLILRYLTPYVTDPNKPKLIEYFANKDTHRLARLHATLTGTTYTPVLPPVWVGLDSLIRVQQAAAAVIIPAVIQKAIFQIFKELRDQHKHLIGDRRIEWGMDLLRARAVLDGQAEVGDDQLTFLKHCWWDEPKHQGIIEQLALRLANPYLAKVKEYYKQAKAAHDNVPSIQGISDPTKKTNELNDTGSKIRNLRNCIEEQHQAAQKSGAATVQIEHLLAEVSSWGREMAKVQGLI